MSNRQSVPELAPNLRDSEKCPVCSGSGVITWTENGMLFAKECSCQVRMREERLLRFANIPQAFAGMELKNFRVDVYDKSDSKAKIAVASKIVKQYLDNYEDMEAAGLGLYIHSNTKGSGKTRLAVSIANELIKKRYKAVKFATSTMILQEIKKSWDKQSEMSESRLLYDLTMTEVLIIDDFGTEQVAGWINDKFYHIINERYINNRITIFTSNVPIDKLKYDDRIISRIEERTYQVAFPEESVRTHIAAENNAEMISRIK